MLPSEFATYFRQRSPGESTAKIHPNLARLRDGFGIVFGLKFSNLKAKVFSDVALDLLDANVLFLGLEDVL